MHVATTQGYGTNGMPCNLPYQAILPNAGLPYRPTPCAPILISASSSTSSISYLPEMTCGTRCRLSSQNIPKLTSAHWASHQATGRKNHCGAHDDEDRDCRKKEKICHITNPSPLHHLTLYLLYMRVRHRLMTHPPVFIFKCQYLKISS